MPPTLTLQTVERVQIATLGGADVDLRAEPRRHRDRGGGDRPCRDRRRQDRGHQVRRRRVQRHNRRRQHCPVRWSGTRSPSTAWRWRPRSTTSARRTSSAIIGGDGHDLISAGAIAAGKAVVQTHRRRRQRLRSWRSKGNDSVVGGAGNDFIILGAGNDIFTLRDR